MRRAAAIRAKELSHTRCRRNRAYFFCSAISHSVDMLYSSLMAVASLTLAASLQQGLGVPVHPFHQLQAECTRLHKPH